MQRSSPQVLASTSSVTQLLAGKKARRIPRVVQARQAGAPLGARGHSPPFSLAMAAPRHEQQPQQQPQPQQQRPQQQPEPEPVARAWALVHRALDRLLRETYGHELSVQLLALAAVALLASAALYFAAPLLEDDYHLYQRYLPWARLLDWSHYDSFVIDHAVVFATIALPVGWLLTFHVAYSSIASRVEVALLALRVASCLTVSAALTVLLTEFFSRRAMLAILALAYGSLGILYSWSVPLWRWYMTEARARGLVAFLPEALQQLLLHTSLLEWLTDTSFSDKMRPFLPFLLPLSRGEQLALLEQMPVETQRTMTRPGFLLPMLPGAVQRALLPAADSDNEDEGEDKRSSLLLMPEMNRASDGDSSSVAPTSSSGSDVDAATENTALSTGFDFHRPEVRESVLAPRKTPDQIMNDIVTARIWRFVGSIEGIVKVWH